MLMLKNIRQIFDYNSELIQLRDLASEIIISESLEGTLLYLEKLAGPFEFRVEETMVKEKLFYYLILLAIYSMRDYCVTI